MSNAPRRIAAVIALTLLAVVIGTRITRPHHQPSSGMPTSYTAPNPGPAATVAAAFVQQWSALKPGQTPTQWVTAIRALTTPDLGQALANTNTSTLPNTTVTTPTTIRYTSTTSTLLVVPLTNGATVLITVDTTGPRPLVSDIQPNEGN